MRGRKEPVDIRLWSRVARTPSGCWEWTGATVELGYGRIGIEGGRVIPTHRLAWMLYNQADPGDLFIMHTCDNPPCCNPHHLRAGTPLDNTRDMDAKGRRINAPPYKFTDQQVAEIRRRYVPGSRPGGGTSSSELAKEFGISQSHVILLGHGRCRPDESLQETP